MKHAHHWAKPLLWFHLFVCLVWLCLYRAHEEPPHWMLHVYLISILAIQFTWGFTVGLIVGPGRKRRPLLWWSLMLSFMPLSILGPVIFFTAICGHLLLAIIYLSVFVMILACETYCGVLLGAKAHSESA